MKMTLYERIKKWIQNSLKDDSWRKFNDFHLNAKYSDNMLSEYIHALNIANKIILDLNVENYPVLGISLHSSNNKVCSSNLTQLIGKIDNITTSLYLVEEGWNNWDETLIDSINIKLDSVLLADGLTCFLYQEYNQREKKFRQNLFFKFAKDERLEKKLQEENINN